MECISYAGEEAFDVVLYISRILTRLHYRVLIIDCSESNALFMSLKHGMDLDSRKDIVHYRGIDYTRKIPNEEELSVFDKGVVFTVYGQNYKYGKKPAALSSEELIVVVSNLPHSIANANSLMRQCRKEEERLHILIRNIISMDEIDRVKQEITFPYKDQKTNFLFYEASDYECAVRCQTSQIIALKKISSGMKNYMIGQIHEFFPEHSCANIKRAIKAAGRGR